jgi:hypothetical protein
MARGSAKGSTSGCKRVTTFSTAILGVIHLQSIRSDQIRLHVLDQIKHIITYNILRYQLLLRMNTNGAAGQSKSTNPIFNALEQSDASIGVNVSVNVIAKSALTNVQSLPV